MFPSGVPDVNELLGGGYPDRSAVLVIGVTGTNKERLGLRFVDTGLSLGDFCIYVTRLSVHDARLEAMASGLLREKSPFWIATEGGDINLDMNDFATISFNIKNLLKKNSGRRIRIVLDSLSPLLLYNHPETVHRFLNQLFTEVKQHDAVLLGIIDEGMHDRQVLAAMEDLFDGVIAVSSARAETGESPTISVRKMRGVRLTQGGVGKALPPARFDKKRIAVLPFENISPNPEDGYFADGMTEELIATMSKISGLRVIAKTSVNRYKSKEKSISEIAKELEAGSILEGGVRIAGEHLRTTVQLIDSETSEHLWSESYDRELKDVLAVQSDISKIVAEALKVKLLSREEAMMEEKQTVNPEAYTLYLKGRFYWNERKEASVKKAVKYFEKALEVDPRFAPAYSGSADCYNTLVDFGLMASDEASPLARELATKALEIDQNLAEAHASLGWTLMVYYWDFDSAEREFKRAIELKPNYAIAYHWYGTIPFFLRHFEEMYLRESRAIELDPYSRSIGMMYANALAFLGRTEEAMKAYKHAIEINPDFPAIHEWKSMVHVWLSEFDIAIHEAQTFFELDGGPESESILAWVHAAAGKKDEAQKILDHVKSRANKEYLPPVWIGMVELEMGRREEGFKWLEKALSKRDSGLLYFNCFPWLEKYRSDPRWREFERNLGPRGSQNVTEKVA